MMNDAAIEPFAEADGFRSVITHLIRRGVLTDPKATVIRLSGGVSNDVLAVSGKDVHFVVKRALSRLRVEEEWYADPDRLLAEAAALEIAAALQPARVPPVLDIDAESRIVVIGFAEDGAHEWKSELLEGVLDLDTAALLGRVLARWHADTRHSPDIRSQFGSLEAFDQLRIDPFYRWTAQRHPNAADVILSTAERMLASRTCLVHGDFSPKNILVGPTSTWVIDWEVAHYGDPVFDLAFLVSHLACKALHRPEHSDGFRQLTETYLANYRSVELQSNSDWDENYLAQHIACLMLARIDGKSPVPYLNDDARDRGRSTALKLLSTPELSLFHIWKALS
ncbi:aminoglycoside phosphotransferase family protein [Paenarthrobacter nitroguajacolicus]|uniref:aminoglycoside phosphotransferase family protein n=1 Tax=Paenarthrobacter nitroguajacolicus TaxID=211146 RepID=UPI003D1E20D4